MPAPHIDRSFLAWPFLDDSHRALVDAIEGACVAESASWSRFDEDDQADVDRACRHIVQRLGALGVLRYAVPGASGGVHARVDVRSLCIVRETLGRHVPLADFSFAMQGLGSGPISLFGSDDLKTRYLPRVAQGTAIAAFALSEAGAGSDISAMATHARRDGTDYVLDGEKTWISNGGIADFYVVFARTPDDGAGTFGAFVVDADASGLTVSERIRAIAAHPLARLTFDGCRVPARHDRRPGKGSCALAPRHLSFDGGARGAGFCTTRAERAIDHAVRAACSINHSPTFTAQRAADIALDTRDALWYRAAWFRDTSLTA